MRITFLLFEWIGLFLFIGCSHKDTISLPLSPDYSDPTCWFQANRQTTDKSYDIFYIVPTCIFDWKDEKERIHHHMDVYNTGHQESVNSAIMLAKNIFADSCNFFSPYYRQISIESWMTDKHTIEERYKIAFEDIQAAFEYFMLHHNNNRPFILAGHSQGGKAVLDLLKYNMNSARYSRLVAAYPMGYPVKQKDLGAFLKPARDSIDTGVIISFNSVSDNSAIANILSEAAYSINPLNWQTDSTYAPKSEHLGFVTIRADGSIEQEIPHLLGAYIDPKTKALIVDGVQAEDYYLEVLSPLFPQGNYHIVELNFFYRNLQRNILSRIRNYRATQNNESDKFKKF